MQSTERANIAEHEQQPDTQPDGVYDMLQGDKESLFLISLARANPASWGAGFLEAFGRVLSAERHHACQLHANAMAARRESGSPNDRGDYWLNAAAMCDLPDAALSAVRQAITAVTAWPECVDFYYRTPDELREIMATAQGYERHQAFFMLPAATARQLSADASREEAPEPPSEPETIRPGQINDLFGMPA